MATSMQAGRHARWERALGLLLAAAPFLFAVPVFYGIAASLVDLLGTGHPYFLDPGGVNLDGLAFRRGEPLYQDPAAGYTPEPYTPLLPLLTAGLDLFHEWSGWTLLLTILSALGLMGLVGWMAWAPADGSRAARLAALAGAAGIAAVAFWLVSFVPFNLLYFGRSDHLAWALGLAGLLTVPAVIRGSPRAAAAMLVLLSLSCWAKQTGALAAAVGLGWLFVGALRGLGSWRRAAMLSLVFVGLNGALWLVLDRLTDGWSVVFTVDLPSRHGNLIGFGESLGRLGRDALVPALLAAVLWAPAAWRRLHGGQRPTTGPGDPAADRVAACGPLLAFAVISVPLTARTGQALGSVDNHYVGLIWALLLVAAAGFGLDQRRRPSAVVAAMAVVALFAVTEGSAVTDRLARHRIFVASKSPRASVSEEPPALRSLAERRAVYHPVYSDVTALGGRVPFPSDDNLWGLYIAGTQPRHFVDALLQRRFDVVYAFQDRGFNNGLRADSVEDAYSWKLNEVIRRKYRPARVSPALDAARTVPLAFGYYVSPGVYERAAGPDPAPWLSACFGPFRLGATTWDIRSGGGLWCRLPRGGQTLRLVATPALASEVRSRGRGAPQGVVGVDVPGAGGFAELAPAGNGPAWTLRVERPAGARAPLVVSLTTREAGRAVLRVVRGPARLRLRPASPAGLSREGDDVLVRVPADSEHPLLLRGSVTSRAKFDLAGLRLR